MLLVLSAHCHYLYRVYALSRVLRALAFMTLKIKLFCLLVIAFLSVSLSGCSLKDKPRQHFLWKISDQNSSVYILGSIHFADKTFYPLDAVIVNAFDHSDELAVEIDVSDTSVYQKSVLLSSLLGNLDGDKTLDMFLPEDALYSLDSLCLAWSIPLDFFSGYKPWAAAMTLSSIANQRSGLDAKLGIDLYFLTKAREMKKKITSLETVELQVKLFTGMDIPDSIGVFALKNMIKDIALLDSSIAKFKMAWKTGNDSLFTYAANMGMDRFSHEDSLMHEFMNDKVLYSRNGRMADSVSKFLDENRNVFVVVGAAHLAGHKKNVLEILRRKGLTVEQL